MPFFKKKEKPLPVQSQPQAQSHTQSQSHSQPQSLAPPAEGRPDLREEPSNSTFGTAPSNHDGDSNLSSADTRVNQQRDSNGNRQTVVTTTTTTTTTTVTADGRVITEQHDRPVSELPATRSPRPRSPENAAPQIPVQDNLSRSSPQVPVQVAPPPTPSIPNRDARRNSQVEPLTSSNMLQPPPPMPYQQGHEEVPQPTTSPTSLNFSRPGGRRDNVKKAVLGLHGAGEGLRGAINTKAGELLGDDPDTLAKNREVRDKGMRDARVGNLLQRKPLGQADDDRKRLRRRSGNLGTTDDHSRNF